MDVVDVDKDGGRRLEEVDEHRLNQAITRVEVDVVHPMRDLSSTCRRHVGDMSATSPNVAKSWPTLRVGPTRKSPRHTQFSSITANKYKSVQTYELATLP